MPYIILKRSDIPAATLQVLDLAPNTSQRNLIYDPPGQTKYVNPVQNDTVVLHQPAGGGTPILSLRESTGLASWFITNVNDGTGAFAAGSFSIAAGNAADGDTVTINAGSVGGPTVVFTFRAVPVTSTDVLIGGTEDISASNLAGAINLAANGLNPYISAAAPGGGPPSAINLTAVIEGTASNGIVLAVSGVNLSFVAMAGGVDANALSAADANANAAAVIALYGFGDLTSAAGTLTLGDINGALVTGTLTTAQLSEVLDILAGRVYELPAGVQVDADGTTFSVVPAIGADGGPGFVSNSLRNVYDSGSLILSFATGELEGFVDSGFIYAGVAGNPNGEAVVVYNDDGTFYTP
jgi:hypothetical protein